MQRRLRISDEQAKERRALTMLVRLQGQKLNSCFLTWINWHREAVLNQSLLVDKLAAVSNEQVFQAAKKVFDDQQMIRSFLIPPNVKLNSDINCQVVIP